MKVVERVVVFTTFMLCLSWEFTQWSRSGRSKIGACSCAVEQSEIIFCGLLAVVFEVCCVAYVKSAYYIKE